MMCCLALAFVHAAHNQPRLVCFPTDILTLAHTAVIYRFSCRAEKYYRWYAFSDEDGAIQAVRQFNGLELREGLTIRAQIFERP